ncbi:hypothetical protein HDU97_002363 [Phlyctochytrium planicorne]|nr:hypothetical protein HDU97_002363 [Phlyctochytrium planicorne]
MVHDLYTSKPSEVKEVITSESSPPIRRYRFTLPYNELKAEYSDSQFTEHTVQQWDRVERVLSFMVPVSELKGNSSSHQPQSTAVFEETTDAVEPIQQDTRPPKSHYVPQVDAAASDDGPSKPLIVLDAERGSSQDSIGIRCWSVSRVTSELTSAGLNPTLIELLKECNIDGQELLILDRFKLQEMGIGSFEARQLCLMAVGMLKERDDDTQPPEYS